MMPTTNVEHSKGQKKPAIGWLKLLICLLLFGGLIFLMIRSYRRTDVLAVYTYSGKVQGIASHRGHLMLAFSSLSFGPEKALTADATSVLVDSGDELYEFVYHSRQNHHELFGFGMGGIEKGELPGDATVAALVAPHWFAIAVAAVPLLFGTRGLLGRLRVRRRLRDGLCIQCGYDLRGSPGRCPECGLAPAPSS